jgi:DNA-binding XRE family transcriptional regulator
MLAKMRLHTNQDGAEIRLSVPTESAIAVADAIRGMLALAGHKVRQLNADGEDVVSAEQVFPDASPAMALRGFRGKLELTQKELAERLGTMQNCVSAMESGKRPISRAMAARLGKVFAVPYKVFL